MEVGFIFANYQQKFGYPNGCQIKEKHYLCSHTPTYINMTEYKRQDITTELRGALQEVKEHIEGKKLLQSLDSLLEEL